MNPETYRDWGTRVRHRREGMKLSQEKLGEMAGVDQSTISRLERGQLAVTDELKWKVAGALMESVDNLFPYPNVRPPFPEVAAS